MNSNLKGLSITCGFGNPPTVILLRGKPGPGPTASYMKVEGVRLAEFLNTELPAVTLEALSARLAEMTGGVTDVALRDLARELAAVIRSVQWIEGCCPACSAGEKEFSGAHFTGCNLSAAMRKAEKAAGND